MTAMRVPLRLVAFIGVLALVFGGSVLVGRAVEPGHRGLAREAHVGGQPEGLAVSSGGYTLVADQSLGVFRFRITDRTGATAKDFDLEQERRMHLIVVRRDATLYQHLHPEQAPDGSWSTPLTLSEPGVYRAFADFAIGGTRRTLGVDVHVSGEYKPVVLELNDRDRAQGGFPYVVTMERPSGKLKFSVSDETFDIHEAFVDFEPYLGARGHLVLFRLGDLAYVHADAATDELAFDVTLPSPGRYRAFVQFKRRGEVFTAGFTFEVAS
jgi:hypothetical protein